MGEVGKGVFVHMPTRRGTWADQQDAVRECAVQNILDFF